MIRILLLTPHPLLGACLNTVLSGRPDMEVIGTERNLDRAVEGAKELRPDVVIANSRGPALDPVVQRLLAEGITPVVIVLNAADNHLRIYRSDRSEEREISQIEELEQVIRSE